MTYVAHMKGGGVKIKTTEAEGEVIKENLAMFCLVLSFKQPGI